MKPTFGAPQTGGVRHVDPVLLEQATIVHRAIHTLERLSMQGVIKDDGSITSLFVQDSWRDLKHLLSLYEAQGVRLADIDMGEYAH